MFRSLLRIVGLELGTPLERHHEIPERDYTAIRKILKALADDGKYFAYCPDDDTFIWHQGLKGPWTRDDDGSHFLRLAITKGSPREASLALAFFKKSCRSSHIDPTLKAKRLSQRKEATHIREK